VVLDNGAQFVCVDGPEFDAHRVDWSNLLETLVLLTVLKSAWRSNAGSGTFVNLDLLSKKCKVSYGRQTIVPNKIPMAEQPARSARVAFLRGALVAIPPNRHRPRPSAAGLPQADLCAWLPVT